MSSHSGSKKLIAVLFGLSLVAAACGSSSGSKSSSATTTTAAATTTIAESAVPTGRTLTIGAEQDAQCADWIDECAGSSWGYWMMNVATMPVRSTSKALPSGAYEYTPDSLLTGMPTIVTTPKQVVTYHINPKAVWSDGQPITSADFQYTWDQIDHGTDIYDPTGYNKIASVDDSDPHTAIVTYLSPYPGWMGLFGGGYGIFPSHILKGKNRDDLMKNGYSWSGGPWEIKSWQKGTSITLVPNPNYWGDKPKLASVVFKFQTDTSAEFTAYKSGQTSVIYPQPQLDAVSQITAGLPNTEKVINTDTGSFEALWLNDGKFPFNDLQVRKALAYSIDRTGLVKTLFGGLGVTQPLQVLNAPILASYENTQAYAGYTLNLAKAASILTADGWKKGSDGIYAKGGKELAFQVSSTTGNKRRQITEEAIQQQLQKAGIKMTIKNYAASDLFGTVLPAGNFGAGIYAQELTAIDPGNCTLFCSSNIPSAANKQTGENWTRTNVPALDPKLEIVDSELNEPQRARPPASLGRQADRGERDLAADRPAARHPALEHQGGGPDQRQRNPRAVLEHERMGHQVLTP